VVGDVVTIEVPAATPAPVGATLIKTGQTTSYRTGDDGDLEAGRATDFFTLASNNPFGNTNRFTDELGGSTYTNDIVIDWSTYDGATVSGYYKVLSGNITWNQAIDECLVLSVGTFNTGWRLINRKELFNLINHSLGGVFNYFPISISGATLWTSTTWASITTSAFTVTNTGLAQSGVKTNLSGQRLPIRTFTVTGTTLI
jgi:hypothetical protein